MGRLLAFLFENPIILFALAAWVFGAIGKASTKAARRATPPAPPTRQPARQQVSASDGRSPDRRAEEIAAEMRRLLGMEEPAAAPPPPRPMRRDVVEPERPPVPLQVVTRERRLPRQEQSHVGESLQQRYLPESKPIRGKHTMGGHTMGGLGGRNEAHAEIVVARSRLVGVGDLKRALVMAEVLGKPLAMRPNSTGGLP